jgi:hypothetical protein
LRAFLLAHVVGDGCERFCARVVGDGCGRFCARG